MPTAPIPGGAARRCWEKAPPCPEELQVIDRALGGLERSDSGKPLNLRQSTETFLVTIADVVSSADRSSMHSLHGPLIAKIVCTFRVCEAPTSKLLSGPRSTSRYCRVARVAHNGAVPREIYHNSDLLRSLRSTCGNAGVRAADAQSHEAGAARVKASRVDRLEAQCEAFEAAYVPAFAETFPSLLANALKAYDSLDPTA
jgi:hypothetical protein